MKIIRWQCPACLTWNIIYDGEDTDNDEYKYPEVFEIWDKYEFFCPKCAPSRMACQKNLHGGMMQ